MTIEEFTELVNYHDLTYSYSDDGRVWSRGQAQYDKIVAASKQFAPEDVKRVWDAMVDRALLQNFREPFYWRVAP